MFTGMSGSELAMLMTGSAAIGYLLIVDRLPRRWRLAYALLLVVSAAVTFAAGMILGDLS